MKNIGKVSPSLMNNEKKNGSSIRINSKYRNSVSIDWHEIRCFSAMGDKK